MGLENTTLMAAHPPLLPHPGNDVVIGRQENGADCLTLISNISTEISNILTIMIPGKDKQILVYLMV